MCLGQKEQMRFKVILFFVCILVVVCLVEIVLFLLVV